MLVRPSGDGGPRQLSRRLFIFRMHGDRQAKPRGRFHSPSQCLVIGIRKVVDPAGAHEGLEADYAAFGQLF